MKNGVKLYNQIWKILKVTLKLGRNFMAKSDS